MLAVDIGNGSIKFARFRDGELVGHGRLPLSAPAATFPQAATWAAVSVNDPVLQRLRSERADIAVIGEHIAVPIEVHYDPPEDCGLDRVLGVVGALDRLPEVKDLLLFDAGTCLTATLAVRGQGVLGGAILPGPELMARALADGTAALPFVEPGPPKDPVGRSTRDSIRAGVDAATLGAVSELVRRFTGELGRKPVVVVTGTGGPDLAARCPEIDDSLPLAQLWGVRQAHHAAAG